MAIDNETETMHCPTCGASQQWSDACRRCKCDLSLVHRMLRYGRHLHRACLVQLRQGNVERARTAAQRYHRLMPTETSRRLLAVCCALSDDMQAAVRLAAED
jgi:hypothetical protein